MIYPSAIESAEAFGAAILEFQTVRPPSIFQPEPLEVRPSGVEAEVVGQAIIGPSIAPAGFGGEAFGQSTARIELLASAIATAETFGTQQLAAGDWSIVVLPVQ